MLFVVSCCDNFLDVLYYCPFEKSATPASTLRLAPI